MRRTAWLGAATGLVAFAVAMAAGQASAAGHPARVTSPARAAAVTQTGPVCDKQLQEDTGSAALSQKFLDADMDVYDSRAADDFMLNETCSLASVDVLGQYLEGAGPAVTENIVIYTNAGRAPGKVIYKQTVVGEDSTGTGSFHLMLPQPISLRAGTYWISVRANLAFAQGGEWGWEATHHKVLKPGTWHNQGGGFGVCKHWAPAQDCVGVGPDFMFSLNTRR